MILEGRRETKGVVQEERPNVCVRWEVRKRRKIRLDVHHVGWGDGRVEGGVRGLNGIPGQANAGIYGTGYVTYRNPVAVMTSNHEPGDIGRDT